MSYSAYMQLFIRKVFMSFFIVAFAFSGATWAACIELPVAPTATVAMSHAHQHDVVAIAAHQHDQVPVPQHDHAPVVKCCSMAPVVGLAPNLSASHVDFSGDAVTFRLADQALIGFVEALDPGIPKTVV